MAFPAGAPAVSGAAVTGAPLPQAPVSAAAVPAAPVSAGRRRFSAALVAATLVLIFAGAEVKSRQAGLSVPDWPLSYGMVWPPMVGNIFYEHGHRTIATLVGLLTVVLAVWTVRVEPRRWARRLAGLAVAAVVAQGVLGGLTVLLLLPPAVSIGHGLLAQTFLLLVTLIAYANSREWFETRGHACAARSPTSATRGPGGAEGEPAGVATWRGGALGAVALAGGAVYVQLGLGLLVRHTESGLAVPFFPLSPDGALLPDRVDSHVVLQMLHRGFALVVLALVLRAALRAARAVPALAGHARLMAGLVCAQVLLGASVIWTAGVDPSNGTTPIVAPVPTSLHVVTGAGLLATTFLLALRCARRDPRRAGAGRPAPSPGPAAAPGSAAAEIPA